MVSLISLLVILCCQYVASKPLSTAVFLQIGNMHKLNETFSCVNNIVEAKRLLENDKEKWLIVKDMKLSFNIDLYVSYVSDASTTGTGSGSASDIDNQKLLIENMVKSFGSLVNNYVITSVENVGLDVGQFLNQLNQSETASKSYDVALKIHSKSNKVWAEHTYQCLCGTPSHVISILNEFQNRPDVHLISPQGLLFSSETPKEVIHPVLIDTYFSQTELSTAFSPANVNHMKSLYKIIFDAELNVPINKLLCDAGTMFWVRYGSLSPKKIVAALPALADKWSRGYVRDSGIEHALERLIPTWIVKHGGKIGEMIPAPKVLPLYFPQYHTVPENDRFHGAGFTEWTLLKPLKDYPGLMKPLSEEQGGLGYYNLTFQHTRRRQAELATIAGVHGFVYYHYWFSGEKAPKDHLVMHKVPEWVLEDGQPDKPFMLSWANEPWTRTWVGAEEDVLLSQEYGDEKEWIEHFNYLLKFFKHPNYIRVNDKPAFAIYRIGHFQEKLPVMLRLWNSMAQQNGLKGIHFINTIGNFLYRDTNTYEMWKKTPEIEAAFHFRPQLRDPFNEETDLASTKDLPLQVSTTQYWGAYTSFDARPRRPTADAVRSDFSPTLFYNELKKSFEAMSMQKGRFVPQNLYFVTAWNEWNEQAVLEPDERNGFGYLLALKTALETIKCKIFAT